MKNSIKILLTLVIGIAVGAITMKTFTRIKESGNQRFTGNQEISRNKESDDPWKIALDLLVKEKADSGFINEAYSASKDRYFEYVDSKFSFVSNDSTRVIPRDTAALFIDEYLDDPFPLKIKSGEHDGKRLLGWYLEKSVIQNMLMSNCTGVEILLSRKDVPGKLSNQMTIITCPVNLIGDTYTIADANKIYEYLRPCPPRCSSDNRDNPFK